VADREVRASTESCLPDRELRASTESCVPDRTSCLPDRTRKRSAEAAYIADATLTVDGGQIA
jgi:hypothetical protein